MAESDFNPQALITLQDRIRSLRRRRRTLLIGIDGRGGSGKSTLARRLAALIRDSAIVEFDDFYRLSDGRRRRREASDTEIGGDFDWRRVRDQVLQPLAADGSARYQRYDWDRDELAEWHEIEPGGIVIVEGNYATRPELRDIYDLTIWVEAPHDLRLERGLERDGQESRERWLDEWMPEEDRYIAVTQPVEHADLVVDGSGSSSFHQTGDTKQ